MSDRPASGGPGRRPRRAGRRKSGSGPFSWVLPVAAIVVIGLVIFTVVRWHRASTSPVQDGKPVPPGIMTALTQIPQSTWSAAGASSARPPDAVPPTDPVDSAAPQVFYLGAEFCPYCAAERWPLIVALARFGKFQGLSLSTSSANDVDPSTPTFTFHGSSYTSQYLKLETVETRGNVPQGNSYPILETPTAAQQAIFRKYDTPPFVSESNAGAIPFLIIGQTYLWVGASYSASDLQGETWQTIAAKLPNAQGKVGLAIVANANMITAAICRLNGGRPAEVCGNAGVKAAAAQLPAAPATK